MKALEWLQHFSIIYKSIGIFQDTQWQLTHILPNFEPIRDFMVVLVSCKNKEEPIKNKGARVVTRFSPL